MPLVLPSLCVLLLGAPAPPETRVAQVAPACHEADAFARTPRRERAVVLLHGLRPQIFSETAVKRAEFRDWQKADSALVKRLGRDSDVYAFAYGQNVATDEVVEVPALKETVERLGKMGYREIVLVGYSAGGLIARQFVEDYPDSGVAKVVQVCAPNGGSSWAKLKAVRSLQLDFLGSLTKEQRARVLRERVDKRVPEKVEFVCVVANGAVVGDGLVSCQAQWTDELQEQGVPAHTVGASHWMVLRGKKGIELVSELVRDPQPRWDAARVTAARKQIIGK